MRKCAICQTTNVPWKSNGICRACQEKYGKPEEHEWIRFLVNDQHRELVAGRKRRKYEVPLK
jgi:hypothetical protein